MFNQRLAQRATSLAAACASLFSLTMSSAVRADNAGTVVVTAARSPQNLTDALPHTTVITREQIEQLQALDLASLLATEAGVQVASNGGRGTATSLFMRGAPMRQVLVLVDGVPLSRQDATGQVGIEHLMLDQVDRIEIVRGNVSALYGSGAVGGVIQVFTRGGQPPRASLQVEAGARGFGHLAAQTGQQWGDTRVAVGLSAERDSGLSALDAHQVPAANPDRDGYRNRSANLDLSHRWAAGHTLSLGLLRTDGKLDYDSLFATPADTQRSRTVRTQWGLASVDRLSDAWTSRLSLSRQRDDAQYVETGNYGFTGRYRTVVDSLLWQNDITLSEGLKATAGLERQRQHIDADDGMGGLFTPTRKVTALFGGVQQRIGAHDLALNLRLDDVGQGTSRRTGRLGWGWHVAPDWTLTASVANAFGLPPLGYLYAPYYGNPGLQAERSNSAELGLQWAAAGQRLRATLFKTRVSDEIDYDFNTGTFSNISRTRNQGLELSYGGEVRGHQVNASLTAQQPEDALTGDQRLRRSRTLASLAVSRPLPGGWRMGMAARYASARPDSGGASLSSYTVLDLTTQWDINAQWQWFARIENAFNARYQTAANYSQAPRGVFTGLRWKLP
jgi:vitamin B12 transporter